MTPEERSAQATHAVRARWAKTADRSAATAPARAVGPQTLEWHAKRLDPDGELEPAERECRAEAARRDYFARASAKSATVRSAKSAVRRAEYYALRDDEKLTRREAAERMGVTRTTARNWDLRREAEVSR